ncbi:MAG: hypothetical protein WD874_01435 [Parcubacteria group bacterium]
MRTHKDRPKNFENTVVDIDGVEYFIDKDASELIRSGEPQVKIQRLFDQRQVTVTQDVLKKAFQVNGIVDFE